MVAVRQQSIGPHYMQAFAYSDGPLISMLYSDRQNRPALDLGLCS